MPHQLASAAVQADALDAEQLFVATVRASRMRPPVPVRWVPPGTSEACGGTERRPAELDCGSRYEPACDFAAGRAGRRPRV